MAKKYLDNTGLSTLWNIIKNALNLKLNTNGDAYRASSIPFGQVDSTSTSTVFTATVDGITELRDGVCMWLKNGVVTSASGFTININNLGAKPVYSNLAEASRSTTIFNVNYTMLFVYNSTRVSGGCWDIVYGYDSNTNTIGYQVRHNSGTGKASAKTYRYRLLFTGDDDTLVPANTSSSTNATATRAVNQTPIDPFGPIYYYGSTTAVDANSSFGAATLWQQYAINLGYSFNNVGEALTLSYPKAVYIKATPTSDGKAIIDADTPYVQTLPTVEDGDIYIYLGQAYSATNVELDLHHPVYEYKNGKIQLYTGMTEKVTDVKIGSSSLVENGIATIPLATTSHSGLMSMDDKTHLNELIEGMGGGSVSPEDIATAVAAYLDEHLTNPTNPPIDTSLSIAGAAADAKEVGDQLSTVKEGFNEITAKMKKVVSENKWDAENEVVGAITANGTVYPNYTSYVYPNTPIEVSEGDVVRSYEINAGGGFATAGMRWLCAYDASMNPVTASGSNTNITSYTVPAGIKYIRPSFNSGGQKRMLTINYEASSWINYEVYYEAGDEFHTDIKMAQTNFSELYLDYSMLNRLDPSDCQTGKFINGTTGAISDNASYYVTNYMEIRSGETLYFMQRDTKVAVNARTIAVYDANKELLDALGTNTSTDHFAQTGKAAFIRCSFAYSASDIIRTPYGIGVMNSATPKYVTGYGDVPIISKDHIRPVINVYATDSEQDIISKFVQAFNHGDCDVVFERASYSFGTQLATVKDDYHLFENEIPIGNGCRYFFNGATLTALINPSSTPSCNFFGCQKRPSSYEMHDGVLIVYGTVYVVHDESSAYVGTYKHLYQNTEMHYNSNSRTDEIRKCIGGGTGASGVVEIVGCKFTTDAVDACVSYHGNGTDVTGAEFDLTVRNSYFSNGLRAGELSAHQTARLFYTGNSSASAPLSYTGWTVTSFLNEIRG